MTNITENDVEEFENAVNELQEAFATLKRLTLKAFKSSSHEYQKARNWIVPIQIALDKTSGNPYSMQYDLNDTLNAIVDELQDLVGYEESEEDEE